MEWECQGIGLCQFIVCQINLSIGISIIKGKVHTRNCGMLTGLKLLEHALRIVEVVHMLPFLFSGGFKNT